MTTQIKSIFFTSLFFCKLLFSIFYAQSVLSDDFYNQLPFCISKEQIAWAENHYNQMTLDEKIGQLFMVAAYSNQGQKHTDEIRNLIEKENIGGLIFMQGTVNKQVELTEEYQKLSKVPLLISMDAEWGAGMRIDEVEDLPWLVTLGAMQDNSLVYQYGEEIANQLKYLGVQMNFGPVVDVNTNANNPIIGSRSFGSDVENVSEKAIEYTNGLQDKGILACAKHFPGHGDTSTDSHKTLPLVDHPIERLNSVELVPFQQMIDAGVASIMVAHLNVPSLESNPETPSTLSKSIVTDLLKEKMGFRGLIITDALNMSGVTQSYPKGEVDYMAFLAGNDVLLFSQAVDIAKTRIKKALENQEIPMLRLEESVKKILMAKYAVGLHEIISETKPETKLETEDVDLLKKINSEKAELLRLRIAENAITTLKNKNNFLPISKLYDKKIAYVKLDNTESDVFFNQLTKFADVTQIDIFTSSDTKKLDGYDYAIVGIHKNNATPFVSSTIKQEIKDISISIAKTIPTVLCLFASPYGLKDFDLSDFNSVVVGYQNSKEMQLKVPEVIFGAAPSKGKLPVHIDSKIKAGDGIKLKSNEILGYGLPIEVEMSTSILEGIDEIANQAIKDGVAPGMQILVARKGKVVYEKNFGNTIYGKEDPITSKHIYDVASVTKVVATLPLVMKALDEKKIKLTDTLGDFLPKSIGTNKSGLELKNILGHQSGLVGWIPFYKETVDERNGEPYLDYYRRKKEPDFSMEIEDNLHLLSSFKDTIYSRIYESTVGRKVYLYSDLGFYFLKDIVETVYDEKIDKLALKHFYEPLNMIATGYLPLQRHNLNLIVPTEKDKYFRSTLVHGKVHDQAAALFGGLAGHAGVFSNATDLAKIMQMYLNGGFYNGNQLLKKESLEEFTKYQFLSNNSRRGLGFDKQQLKGAGPTCGCASSSSFGHQGFTGTMVWADPDKELVYIFLSNRVYPDADNNKISENNIRSRIQQIIYDAIL